MRRIFDIFFSLVILIALLPLLVLIAFLVRISQGKPIIFKHPRMGKNHQTFKIYKFCTMNSKRDSKGDLLPDNLRISRIGSFLRRTSLDELPGFINVLKGEMSIVGPRPLPPQYKDRYSKEEDRRHEIRPGITGWAQVNGRNAISWEQKFKYDIWYLNNQSFYLDLKIILLTVINVLLRKDIVPYNGESMEEFMGTNRKFDQ